MKQLLRKNYLQALIVFTALLISFSCKKDEADPQPPVVSFDRASMAVNTDDNNTFDLKILLSTKAFKEFSIKLNFSGTAIEGEHYTVPTKEILVAKGATEAILPISILNDQIFESELTIIALIAPGLDYLLDPQQTNQATITLTKEIVLPELYFTTIEKLYTNPFLAETFKLNLSASEALNQEAQLQINVEGPFTLGVDFLINNTSSNIITFPASQTAHEIELSFLKKDEAGINEELKLTLTPVDPKKVAIYADKATRSIEVKDPLVDFSLFLSNPALGGAPGFRIRQAIKTKENTWSSTTVVVNTSAHTSNKNHLVSHRNLSYISTFDCLVNGAGGDVLRLANLLKFATNDTTIADYGAASTTRYFSPTESLFRFIADKDNPAVGKVTAAKQKFTAKLVLRAEWEAGANPNRAWQIDSRATNGDITKSTFPSFHTIDIWLEKLEGTYDFTQTVPEVIFTAWFKSDSPFFMREIPSDLDIVKEGNLYKITYRYYPV